MIVGNILIYLSIFLAFAGIFISILHLKTKQNRFSLYLRFIAICLFTTVSITLIYLYILFITSDVSIQYVWSYTSINHPLKYKLAGVLAGMAGSLLFWIWAIVTPWLYEEIKNIKKPVDKDILDWSRIALFSVVVILLIILNMYDIFKPTSANLLLLNPNGQGLNPLLQTDLMVIHPPVVFLAYGFLVIPFAAAFAHLITGRKDWLFLSLNWSRVGWLFLTLGIGLGALWAYVVLGWGGYWGWDPVETSSLIPWILLTGFLHIQLMNKRKNDYRLLAPVTGIFVFIMVIFATFVTRAGGLWVSVHTFGEANVQMETWQRFINLLENNQTALSYMLFIIVCLVITLFLAIRRYNVLKKDKKEKLYSFSELISDEILMLVTTFLFIITTIVTLILLLSSMNGYNPSDYELKVGALVIITVLVLIFCLLWKYTGRRNILIIGGGTLLFSFIAYLVFPDNFNIAISIPILIVAMVGTFYRVIRCFNRKKILNSMKLVSAHLIHLAIVFILIGYVSSNFLIEEDDISLTLNGTGEKVGEYTFKVVDLDTSSEKIFVDIGVWSGNDFIGMKSPGLMLIDGQTRNEIQVLDTPTNDIYLTYKQVTENDVGIIESVDINVKILPLMKFLWSGIWLMGIGMVLRVTFDKAIKRRSKEDKVIHTVKKTKDEKYYEDLVEEELGS